jgi:hypothetical protein
VEQVSGAYGSLTSNCGGCPVSSYQFNIHQWRISGELMGANLENVKPAHGSLIFKCGLNLVSSWQSNIQAWTTLGELMVV